MELKMRCLECMTDYETSCETRPGKNRDGETVQMPIKPDLLCPRCFYTLRVNEPHPEPNRKPA